MTGTAPEGAGGPDLSRRGFIALSVGAGAGLVLGAGPAAAADGVFSPFVRISPDGAVTVIVKHLDKGQGAATGLATLVAEELDADPAQIRTEFAPADAGTYKNFFFGDQGTGGSTAIANSFDQYRQAGAAARDMLLRAAAGEWGASPGNLSIRDGVIADPRSGRSSGFGAFADAASRLEPPARPALKRPAEWRYVGKGFPRVDAPEKSRGAAGLYGMDVQLPDMLVATLAKPPRWGATVRAYDAKAALRVRGVEGVVQTPQGVAVLARSTWPAIKGREALKIDWDTSRADLRSSGDILAEYRALAQTPGTPTRRSDDADAALGRAARVIEAEYEFPFLAHAPMEPLDITLLFDGSAATIWSGSQVQTPDQTAAARTLGIPVDRVSINTLWAGGSFGRRGVWDSHHVVEVAEIARAWGRAQPIKLIHTREDDIRGGYYRPAYVHRIAAGIDGEGNIVGWRHRIVGQSIVAGSPYEAYIVQNGIDRLSVEGAEDMPYQVGATRLELHTTRVGAPVLWWRSVGHTHTAYAVETMIDRLAEAAGRDPVAYRLSLLDGRRREAAVLKLAAERAGWTSAPPAGRHRGVAVHRSFKSYVAQVAEISLRENGTVKVERVTCAVDCGIAVNPDNIRAQMEGSIGYGLGAVLRNEITLTGGAVDQANFDTYEPLRIDDMPDVDVHIVPSLESPTGVGEPGTPPIGPAVANAVRRATGQAVSTLPFSRHGLA